MCRPGEDTRPLGARLPLVVTPSLTHIALFTTAEMDPVDEFKNVVFLPDSLSAPAPLPQRTSTNTPPEAANAPPQRTATTSSTGFISLASGNGLSAMNNPEVSHPSPSTEATSGKPTGVTSSMGNSNVDLTNTKGVLGSSTNGAISSAVSVASSSRANIAPTDPFSVLTPFWEIHHGSTRKELMTCITDPRIKGFMLLTTPKRNGSSVGDGSVSAYDIINIGNKTYASANNSGNSAGAGEGGHARRDGGPGSKSSKTKKNTTTEFAQASFLVQTRNNLELMVLASDRSEQTTADSLGAAALFCSQLQCKRVLRVDLAPGEPLNHYHKEFIVRFLKYVESSYTVQTSLAFATALHCVMQEFYDTYGEEHLEWAAFTLVGMP
ncbi:hypothetical protein AGDE_13975 [Angomonas deanei]|nr:hypothetical protein AGDE_13975 [Angomonas deanei]|eukprot:EPY21553.1 hypothetical protein AGDE_13975 [Angomonas deanei]